MRRNTHVNFDAVKLELNLNISIEKKSSVVTSYLTLACNPVFLSRQLYKEYLAAML